MIFIVAYRQAIEVDFVIDELRRREKKFFRLNTDEYCSQTKLSARLGSTQPVRGKVEQRRKQWLLEEKCAGWLYVPPFFDIDSSFFAESVELAAQEAQAALDGLWHLAHCTWVNEPAIARAAAERLWQLRLAQRVGLTIPDTIVTNDVKEAQSFLRRCEKGAIIKDLATPYAVLGAQTYTSYTKAISQNDLESLGSISLSPSLLEEKISKKHEVRAYVIGENVFAAGIETNAEGCSEEDYRRRRFDVKIWPYELSQELADQCRAVVASAGLKYAGVDLIITPEGEPVFLEFGPYSSWIWVEKPSGLPLTSAFVDLLLELEETGRRGQCRGIA